MSTYYYMVCDRCHEKTDAARSSSAGVCHLVNSDETLLPFIVAHAGHQVRILSEHYEGGDIYGYTEWNISNLDEMTNKDRFTPP